MTIFFGIIMAVLIIGGGIFIYVTSKINKLEAEARDKKAEIDSNLWDRGFQLSKIVEILDTNGVKHELVATDTSTFSLGMPVIMSGTESEKLDQMDRKLRVLLKENPSLLDDDELKQHVDKFNVARTALFKSSIAYNKSANAYNSFIGGFPGAPIAAFHKKHDMSNFPYIFVKIED